VVLLKLREIKIKDHYITIIRRTVQIITFFLINYVILEIVFSLNLLGLEPIIKVLPILNSPRNPLSTGSGILEYIFYAMGDGVFLILLIAILILVLLFTNRSFCGWVCPIGTIQDVCASLPIKKKTMKLKWHKSVLNVKYVFIIILLIFMVPLGVSKNANQLFYITFRNQLGDFGRKPIGFFSLSEFLFVYLPDFLVNAYNSFTTGSAFYDWIGIAIFIFYLIIVALSFWYPRFYCRYFCPFAAVASTISDYAFLKLGRNPVKCVGRSECGICEKVCPKQIRILEEPFEFFTGKGECNFCLACKEKCPHEAINIKFGNV
jgi:polyferredoxin